MVISIVDKKSKDILSKLKILVVDDQPEIRIMVREILSDAGVGQILEASNGRDAFKLIDADFDMINFIICDWSMPNMSGIDLLRQVRTVFPDIPFLMITGRSDKNSVIEAKSAGVTAFIRKPFSPGQLEEKLRVMIKKAM